MKGLKNDYVLFSLIDGKYTYEVMFSTERMVLLYIEQTPVLSITEGLINIISKRAIPVKVLQRMQSFL